MIKYSLRKYNKIAKKLIKSHEKGKALVLTNKKEIKNFIEDSRR